MMMKNTASLSVAFAAAALLINPQLAMKVSSLSQLDTDVQLLSMDGQCCCQEEPCLPACSAHCGNDNEDQGQGEDEDEDEEDLDHVRSDLGSISDEYNNGTNTPFNCGQLTVEEEVLDGKDEEDLTHGCGAHGCTLRQELHQQQSYDPNILLQTYRQSRTDKAEREQKRLEWQQERQQQQWEQDEQQETSDVVVVTPPLPASEVLDGVEEEDQQQQQPAQEIIAPAIVEQEEQEGQEVVLELEEAEVPQIQDLAALESSGGEAIALSQTAADLDVDYIKMIDDKEPAIDYNFETLAQADSQVDLIANFVEKLRAAAESLKN